MSSLPNVFSRRRIDKTVETVCLRGCNYVRQVIFELERDQAADVTEMREMRMHADRITVLAELREIMSVYDESGGGCCPLPESADIRLGIKKASR